MYMYMYTYPVMTVQSPIDLVKFEFDLIYFCDNNLINFML